MHQHASHERPALGRAFAIGVVLNIVYVIVEAGFGVWADSLALLSDAGHNLSDILGLLLAWGGYALAQLSPTRRHTYGWRASTILAALFNSLILLVAIGGIAWEAIERFFKPAEVAGGTVIIVALVGVVINTFTALLFMEGRKTDLNVRGAFLHMAADAGVSVAVVIAGIGIWQFGWRWIDPAVSLLVVVVIFAGTWGLLWDSINLAMQAVPSHIDPHEVEEYLRSLPGVEDVHDLHIWGMSTTEAAMTAHLLKPIVEDDDQLLRQANRELHHRFGIEHVTLQVERSLLQSGCRQGSGKAV